MSQAWKPQRLKATPAEVNLQKKHELTKYFMAQMGKERHASAPDYDQQTAADRRSRKGIGKVQSEMMMRSLDAANQSNALNSQMNSQENIFSQSTMAGGNIHNNINVAINYTVHQTGSVDSAHKRKQKKRLRKSADKKDETRNNKNSSLTKILDRQLLKIADKESEPQSNTVTQANKDSMTNQIFHGDKIYFKNGTMMYKPLGMETVIEAEPENSKKMSSLKPKKMVSRVKRHKTSRFGVQTTEENIAQQQQLDYATAEDLISFPAKTQISPQALYNDDYIHIQSPNYQTLAQKKRGAVGSYGQEKTRVLPQSKSAQKELLGLPKMASIYQAESKTSLNTINVMTSPNKMLATDESRQLHPGLREIGMKLKASTILNASLDLQTDHQRSSNFSSALNRFGAVKVQPSVQFDESAINKRDDCMTRGSVESMFTATTGAEIFSSNLNLPSDVPKSTKTRKSTLPQRTAGGHQKFVQRKLKPLDNPEVQVDELRVQAQTVFSNPSALPNKLTKRAETSSTVPGKEPNPQAENLRSSSDMSKLVSDHKMHQKNRRRIQDLIHLLGKRGNNPIQVNLENLDLDQAESAKAGLLSPTSLGTQKSQLPTIAKRNSTSEVDHAKSTDVGTDLRASAQRLAELENIQPALTDTTLIINNSIKNIENKEKAAQINNFHRPTQSTLVGNCTDLKNGSEEFQVKSPTQNIDRAKLVHKMQANQRYYTKSINMQRSQRIPKYKAMRTSMFNKKTVTLESDGPDAISEYSGHVRTTVARLTKKPSFDKLYSTQGTEDLGIERMSNESNNRSISGSRRLKAIEGRTFDNTTSVNNHASSTTLIQNAHKTQSLSFQGGLTYVMTKGRVQPTENYIRKQMLPYATTQFQSVSIKSNVTRKGITLSKMNNSQANSMASTIQTKNNRGKKLRGSKMKRREVHKPTGQFDKSQKTTQRKGVIEETDQEYSGSDTGIKANEIENDERTWQECNEENTLLKDELLNQIAIFEQYLKVAILQQRAQQQEDQTMVYPIGGRSQSMDENHLLTADNFAFEQDVQNKFMASAERRHKKQLGPLRHPNATIVFRSIPASVNNCKESEQSEFNRQVYTVKGLSPNRRRSSAKQHREKSGSRKGVRQTSGKSSERFNASKGLSQRSRQGSVESMRSSNQKRAFLSMGKKVSHSKLRAIETLGTLRSNMKTTFEHSHQAHSHWVFKINKLWDKLNLKRWQEVVRIQNEIRQNKMHIQQLTRDNLFELDVNYSDQKMLLKARGRKVKMTKKLKSLAEHKRLQALQTRIRQEINRKMEFDTWGFHNYIIAYRVKVRMTEDVIDCAQRLQVKPDQRTEKELGLLTMLRDRTFDDLHMFVKNREKRLWRNWHGGRGYKPALYDREMTLQQVTERVEINLVMIQFLEPRHQQLMRDIPPYNKMNSEMIQFCSNCFGNEGWLQLFQLKQLRKQQEQQQHKKQYMPPVDHIKKGNVDPYTLQIESDVNLTDSNEALSEGPDILVEQVDARATKPSAWEVRRPDQGKATQNKLKTGYEQIMDNIRINQSGTFDQSHLVDSPTQFEGNTASTKYERVAAEVNSEPELTNEMRESQGTNSNQFILVQKYATPAKTPFRLNETQNNEDNDVIQHLKNQVEKQDEIEEKAREESAIKKSKWLQTLEKEKQDRAERDQREKRARAARLAVLFEEEDVYSADDEDLLDAGAAEQDAKNYMEKIDTHLQVEKRLLEAWTQKDKQALDAAAAEQIKK